MKRRRNELELQLLDSHLMPIEIGMTPTWYEPPAAQINRVVTFLKENGGDNGFRAVDIPAVPQTRPLKGNEVLLLTVSLPNKGGRSGLQRTIDAWWKAIKAPAGYTKYRWNRMKSDPASLSLVRGVEYLPGIRWVIFDPMAYYGLSPIRLWRPDIASTLAGPEVLMALAMFPRWASDWDGVNSPFPNLAGCRITREDGLEGYPYMSIWKGDINALPDPQIALVAGWTDMDRPLWCSPTIEEC